MKRRLFLKGVAGAAVAAPFLSSLYEKKARGASAASAAPKRLVMFYTHNGCLTDRWFPKVENGALNAAALAGTTLQTLTPYVSKLLVPRGFKSLNQYGTTQTIDPHDQAMGSKLTCALITDDSNRYASAMHNLHDAVLSRAADLEEATILEYGAPVAPARWTARYAAESFLHAAKTLEDYSFTCSTGDSEVVMEPVGVAGLITPWNANAGFICSKLAYALAAGCTAVIKPSEMSASQTEIVTVVVEAVKKSSTARSSNDGEFDTSTTTSAPSRTSATRRR